MKQKTKLSLSDPFLKTTRAKVHLDALKHELDAFRNSAPLKVYRNVDKKRGRYCIRIVTEDTPDHIPLILGDLLYCLRSSLDQTIWALAKLTTPYPQKTQFPILDKPNKGTFSAQTKGVPVRAAKLIESL